MGHLRKVNWSLALLLTIGTAYLEANTAFLQTFEALAISLFGLFLIPPINDKIQNRLGRRYGNDLNPIIALVTVSLILSIAPVLDIVQPEELYYSDFSEQELRANSTNLSEIGYSSIIRDYSSYQNDIIRLTGKVEDVRSLNDGFLLIVETNYDPGGRYTSGRYLGDRVWIEHEFDQGNMSIDGDRPVEGMVIEVLGEYLGPKEYETAIGSVNTVPRMSLWHAE